MVRPALLIVSQAAICTVSAWFGAMKTVSPLAATAAAPLPPTALPSVAKAAPGEVPGLLSLPLTESTNQALPTRPTNW